MEFQVRYLALFILSSVIDDFNSKAPFLVLYFSCYTLMTFLMMLSVISLYMIMILLSFVSVIRYVICSNNQNWLLKLNLIFETLWTRVGSGLLTSMLEKLISFDRSNITGAVDVKMDASVLEEKSCFKMLRLTFSSKLDWGSYISSIAKTTSKQAGAPSYFLKLISYKSGYAKLLDLHFLPLLNPWHIVEMQPA